MVRSMLSSLVMVGLCACIGCNGTTGRGDTDATITKMDAKAGTVNVKLKRDGKDLDKTFRLAERIEYLDSAGDVTTEDIFTAGDRVLIFESSGTIVKMKHKDKTALAKRSDDKDKTAKVTTDKAPADKDKTDKVAKVASETFIRTADQINLTEMKLGKVAADNAKSEVVKQFGTRALSDHALMNKELRQITTKQGITLSEKLNGKHQELLDDLSKLKGGAFDKAYTADMVADHEKAIELFENEAKHGSDAEVKAWADKCLPTLREHLKLAQAAVKDVAAK